MKKLLILIMMCFLLTSCTNNITEDKIVNEEQNANQEEIGEIALIQLEKPIPGEQVAIMKTSMGDIKLRLFPQFAPKTVENFITHATNGYYDGVTFHRVINDFMIQSGDPTGTGSGGESIWGEPFEDEITMNVLHFRGALSMANPGIPDYNDSQFFIVQAKEVPEMWLEAIKNAEAPMEIYEAYENFGGAPWLDGKHTVFGQVYEGMDVVDKIAAVEVYTDEEKKDKPKVDVIIEKITIEEYK